MTDESEKLDSDEPRRVTAASSPSTASSASSSPSSERGEVAKLICGMIVSLFCATIAGKIAWSMDPTLGPLGVPKWFWGLVGVVGIGAPTSFYQARKLAQAVIALKAGR